jgi:NTE family protein
VRFAGISGTSAGALNAAVLATGLARGGNPGARDALREFWRDVSRSGACFGAVPSAGAGFGASPLWPGTSWTPAAFFGAWARSFSPYEFNPLDLNPLRDAVRRHVDEAALRGDGPKLFVTATAVRTGQPRVFSGAALSIDALLASACLPHLFRAVTIDGEAYWDGGYSGNPALYPLSEDGADVDLLLVKINPLERKATPRGSLDILERVSEIGFNASLLAELRALAATQRQRRSLLRPAGREAPRLHMIADEAGLARYAASSKLDTGLAFLEELCALGRHAASGWLERHAADVGVRSSLDIESVFFPSAGR